MKQFAGCVMKLSIDTASPHKELELAHSTNALLQMKTLTRLFNLLTQPLWKRESVDSWFLSCWQQFLSRLTSFCARVRRAAADGLVASIKATTNNRTYIGLLLILVVAPFLGVAYQIFDSTDKIAGWYYSNWFYFLFVIGPHVQMIVILTGVMYLFADDDRRSLVLILPAGYEFGKLFWLTQVTSNTELHSIVPFSFLIVGADVAIIYGFVFNYLMSLHYHKRSRPVSTMEGAALCEDISEAQLRSIIITETQNLKALK